jgi:outer membrane protein assembly factor BamB
MTRYAACALLICAALGLALGGCPSRQAAAPTSATTSPSAAGQQPSPPAAAGSPGAPATPAATGTPTTGTQVAAKPSTSQASRPGSTVTSDWPRFYGPDGNGLAPSQGLKANWSKTPPAKLWQVAMTDNGYAGPAVSGGRVYILDHSGQEDIVRCLELSSGRDVWSFRYSEPGADNYGFSRATPCIYMGKVYTLGRSGLLHCLDVGTGKKLWVRNLPQDFGGKPPQWNYAASPVVDDNKLIVIPGGSRGTVAALNPQNGQTIWQGGGTDPASYSTPVPAIISHVKQYVVFNGKAITGVKATDGKLLWRVGWETQFDVNAAMPLVAGNRVFITSGYNHGCALVEVQGNAATIVWQNRAMQSHFTPPLLYQGRVYGTSDPGNLVCLEPGKGKVLWQQSGFEKGGLIIVDGLILAFQGADGALVQVKASPAGYQEVGRFTPLGGQSWTAPVVAGGKLIVRSKTALACYQLN